MTTAVQNQKILDYLRPYEPERVGIFGSWARDENQPDSDLDILVKLKKPVALWTFIRMERELSDALDVKVDLVSEGGLTDDLLKQYVFQDLKVISA